MCFQGVPLRLELGPRDIESNSTLAVRRYDNKKWAIPLPDITTAIRRTLDDIQVDMYSRAAKTMEERLKIVTNWDDLVPTLDAKNILVLPWCEDEQCEDDIKERSKSQYVSQPFSILSSFMYLISTGQTREKPRTPRHHRQVPSRSVSHMIRLDSVHSQRARTKSVSSAVKRQRAGPSSEGVSLVPTYLALLRNASADATCYRLLDGCTPASTSFSPQLVIGYSTGSDIYASLSIHAYIGLIRSGRIRASSI